MTPAFNHYNRISDLDRQSPMFLVTRGEVENSYGDDAENIPALAVVRSEFGCDSGLYARYDDLATGVTKKCLIAPEQYDLLVFWEDLTMLDLVMMNFLVSAAK